MRYAVAIVSSAVALGITLLAADQLERTVFVLFFAAVSISAWLGGLGPALLATVLGVLAADYFLIPPRFTFVPASLRDLLAIVVFSGVSVLIAWLTESARRSERRATTQARELEPKIQEAQSLQEELARSNRELARVNKDLERVREFLEQAQSSAHLGSWQWEIARDKVTWSDEMFRVYGLEPGGVDVSFETFLALVHPDDRAMVQRSVEHAFQTREPFAFDHRVVWPDGTIRWLHGRGSVATDADGQPVRMVGSGQDITERRRAADEARAARAEAESANRAKTDFLTAMSHEIRTPLNAIAGFTELLEMEIHGPLTDQQRDALARVRRSQRILQALVDDVLGFAKLEAGQIKFEFSPIPVDSVLARLGELIAPQVEAKKLHYDYGGCDPSLSIFADPERLEQIVLNLLTNAVKFTGVAGRVSVTVREEGEAVAISVTDTGVGIPEDKREAIFEPFLQLSHGPEHKASGIGLGLAISRDLARAMNGDIVVDSHVGDGSTFTIRLPRNAVRPGLDELSVAAFAARQAPMPAGQTSG